MKCYDIREYFKYVYPKNSQLLTIPPTGTISTMIQASGGAEPVFAFKYYRTTKSLHGHDETYEVYHPLVEKYLSVCLNSILNQTLKVRFHHHQ